MNRLDIYKGLAFLMFFPFIFGCFIAKSNITTLLSIEKAMPLTIKIDSLKSDHTGSSGSGHSFYTAFFSLDGKSYMLGLSGDGANAGDYIEKDSVKIWFRPNMKSAKLRDINPTKEEWRKRYLNYLFFWPAGVLIYPFLIFFTLFLIEKRKEKLKSNQASKE